jgi:hypothetical protein
MATMRSKSVFYILVLAGLLLACTQLSKQPNDNQIPPPAMTEPKFELSLAKFIPWSDEVPEAPFQSSRPISGGMIELPGPKVRLSRTSLQFRFDSKILFGDLVSDHRIVLDTVINLGIPFPENPVSGNPQEDGFALSPLNKVLFYDGDMLITDAPGGFLISTKGAEQLYLPSVSAGRTSDGKAFLSGFKEVKAGLRIEGSEQIELVIPDEIEARRIFFVVAVETESIWVKGDADLLQYDRGGKFTGHFALDDSSYLKQLAPIMWELKDVAAGDGKIFLSCSGPEGIVVLQLDNLR